ncbi:hypothetical protein GCM10011506_08880 [Marivirga lumbricoides]|uniref:Uncharacterized protein n=2 Tax=Marivirga lumbricoides TaxID=1046115 RepID=A0ABQ1LNI6_9BACT|nr:hypothetical protein GCM10011506_08880 [Marivirga lumbricoides]
MLMKNKVTWSLLLILLVFAGCDSFENDVYPDKDQLKNTSDVVMSLTPGSPVILDLLQSTQLTGNASISITKQPLKGTASITSTGLLKYIPNQDFITGADSLNYTACINTKCDESKVEFKYADAGSSCITRAVYDKSTLLENSIIIDVLANDIACDETFDITSLKIEESPVQGTVEISDGKVLYTATNENVETDQFIYGVATNENPELIKYGIVDIVKEQVIALKANNDIFEYTYEEYITKTDDWGDQALLTFTLEQILSNDELFTIPAADLSVTMSNSVNGSGSYENGVFNFTTSSEFNGTASFEYQICYENICSTAIVNISVPEYNDGQIQAINDTITFATWQEFYAAMDSTYLSLDFTMDDIFGNDDLEGLNYNQLYISVYDQAAHGNVTYYDLEMIRYTPNESFANSGVDTFYYSICYNNVCSEATVIIKVEQ